MCFIYEPGYASEGGGRGRNKRTSELLGLEKHLLAFGHLLDGKASGFNLSALMRLTRLSLWLSHHIMQLISRIQDAGGDVEAKRRRGGREKKGKDRGILPWSGTKMIICLPVASQEYMAPNFPALSPAPGPPKVKD